MPAIPKPLLIWCYIRQSPARLYVKPSDAIKTFEPVNLIPPISISIAPLQDRHDRSRFASGVPELDRYFQLQASQDIKRKVAALFVLLDQEETVIGYYTLSAYGIHLAELSVEMAKKLPKYPVLPVTLLGRLAVSRGHQGQRLGQFLLIDALKRSWENTREVGFIGVVVDAINESAKRFYQHHEFQPLPGYGRKLFLAMAAIRKLFGN